MGQTFRAVVIAQASAAAAADVFSAGAETALDLQASGNAEGAYEAALELNVTVAPSTATYAEAWVAESVDGTTYGEYKYLCTFSNIGTAAARYTKHVQLNSPLAKIKWKPIAYGATATLNARPSYPA